MTMKTLLLAVLSITIVSAQSPGTCAGMTPGQLTSLNGFVPFQGSSSLWNADISTALVDPNSSNIMNFIGMATTLHPDFGQGNYDGQSIGIPYQVVAGIRRKSVSLWALIRVRATPGRCPSLPTL